MLGDSVTQFSLVIGIYLFAMGAGAWLSRFIDQALVRCFVEVEFCVALLGGCSAPLLLLSFARLSFFSVVLYGAVFAIGVLVGLELPLLMRILKDHLDFKELVSRVLALDYVGALVASLLFPIFCVPRLGLTRTSLVFGMLNALVGLWATWLLRPLLGGSVTGMRVRGILVVGLLGLGLWKADYLTSLAEADLFTDPVVYAKTTPYQRIVVTAGRSGFQLFLNGHLQFHSADEYRYHEALVHPAMALAGRPRRVLVLGGGDGLALREILKIASVEAVTLVDLDAEMTGLSDHFQPLAELNGRAFHDPRVEVVNQDAMLWLAQPGPAFDAVIVDFPDPNSYSLGKLYTTRFYRLLQQRLAPDGDRGRAMHLAAVRAEVVLVHHSHAGSGRLRRAALSRRRAVVRGLGIRPGPPHELRDSHGRPVRAEVPHAAVGGRHVRPAGRPGPAAGGGQSARQPGLGPLSRHRLAALGIT